MSDKTGDIQAAIEAGRELANSQLNNSINSVPVALVPNDMQLVKLTELMNLPLRTEQVVDTETPQAFCEYFNAFADDSSAIFYSQNTGEFVGIIDYHNASQPDWCRHIVKYVPCQTSEASAWFDNSGKPMKQEAFALFIERNAEEITSPPAAEMLEIALTLKAKQKITFSSAKRLQDGQTQFQYIEELEGRAGQRGQLTIPEKFELGMRIYEGGEAYAISARFRYRIGAEPTFWYELIRPERIEHDAIDSIAATIKKQAKCQLFIAGTVDI